MHPSRNNLYIAALIVGIALVLCLVTVRACTDDSEVTLETEPATNVSSHGWPSEGWQEFVPTTTTEAPVVVEPEPVEPSPQSRTVRQSEPVETSGGEGMGDGWEQLRQCEAGGDYSSSDGQYSGAYQFDRQTHLSVGGDGYAGDDSPAEQDAAALRLYAERGASPWPNCGRYLR